MVLWDLTPCSLLRKCQIMGETCCLYLFKADYSLTMMIEETVSQNFRKLLNCWTSH
jgi:hypothetical protein